MPLETLKCIAGLQEELGQLEAALQSYHRSFEAAARQYGDSNPYVAEIKHKIGMVCTYICI